MNDFRRHYLAGEPEYVIRHEITRKFAVERSGTLFFKSHNIQEASIFGSKDAARKFIHRYPGSSNHRASGDNPGTGTRYYSVDPFLRIDGQRVIHAER